MRLWSMSLSVINLLFFISSIILTLTLISVPRVVRPGVLHVLE